jgi:hypothetical protein
MAINLFSLPHCGAAWLPQLRSVQGPACLVFPLISQPLIIVQALKCGVTSRFGPGNKAQDWPLETFL